MIYEEKDLRKKLSQLILEPSFRMPWRIWLKTLWNNSFFGKTLRKTEIKPVFFKNSRSKYESPKMVCISVDHTSWTGNDLLSSAPLLPCLLRPPFGFLFPMLRYKRIKVYTMFLYLVVLFPCVVLHPVYLHVSLQETYPSLGVSPIVDCT